MNLNSAIDDIEIDEGDFSALIKAIKKEFGNLPTAGQASMFIAEWVTEHFPEDTPAVVSIAFMHRYSAYLESA